MRLVGNKVRDLYRRERWPAPLRRLLVAEGMCEFYRTLARGLARPLALGRLGRGGAAEPDGRASRAAAEELLSQLSVRVFARRYEVLRREHPSLPALEDEPRALALLMSQLYLVDLAPRSAWIFSALGGPARGLGERWRARQLGAPLDAEACWRELTVHLGEVLIVLTQELPVHLPHARRVLGDICFVSGQRYAGHFRRLFALVGERGADPAALAIEVLRTSEYLYRVNPEHWGGTDAAARTGYLEGTACPWYTEPGWEAGHCGIFGRFQAGVCAEFGLGYALTSTIPKHGGATCRVDLKPLPAERLRRPKAAALFT